MSNNLIEDVAIFMDASGQTVPGPELANLYLELVREELTELAEAITTDDIVEVADAIADSVWVLLGYGLARGLPMGCIWEEVARSNLEKIGPTGLVLKDANGKVIKPAGWRPPDINDCIQSFDEQQLRLCE